MIYPKASKKTQIYFHLFGWPWGFSHPLRPLCNGGSMVLESSHFWWCLLSLTGRWYSLDSLHLLFDWETLSERPWKKEESKWEKKRKKKSSKSFFLNSGCSLLKGFSLKQCCLQMRVRIRLWKTRKIPQAFAATAACRIKGQLLLQIVFNNLIWIEEKREDKSWKCLFLNSWCRLLKGFSLKQCCLQIRVWIRVWKPWKTPHCAAEH